jgi:hypothetical protein
MTRHGYTTLICFPIGLNGGIGRSCVVDDVCHGPANLLRWLWTGACSCPGAPLLPMDVLCGVLQTYTDLRQLRVGNVVEAILGD